MRWRVDVTVAANLRGFNREHPHQEEHFLGTYDDEEVAKIEARRAIGTAFGWVSHHVTTPRTHFGLVLHAVVSVIP